MRGRLKREIWLHQPTFTLAEVRRHFLIFYMSGVVVEVPDWGTHIVESQGAGWVKIGDL